MAQQTYPTPSSGPPAPQYGAPSYGTPPGFGSPGPASHRSGHRRHRLRRPGARRARRRRAPAVRQQDPGHGRGRAPIAQLTRTGRRRADDVSCPAGHRGRGRRDVHLLGVAGGPADLLHRHADRRRRERRDLSDNTSSTSPRRSVADQQLSEVAGVEVVSTATPRATPCSWTASGRRSPAPWPTPRTPRTASRSPRPWTRAARSPTRSPESPAVARGAKGTLLALWATARRSVDRIDRPMIDWPVCAGGSRWRSTG